MTYPFLGHLSDSGHITTIPSCHTLKQGYAQFANSPANGANVAPRSGQRRTICDC